jgi:hypothetical protein
LSELLPPSYEGRTAKEGSNRISDFNHHNINEGAVFSIVNESTGRSLAREIYPMRYLW